MMLDNRKHKALMVACVGCAIVFSLVLRRLPDSVTEEGHHADQDSLLIHISGGIPDREIVKDMQGNSLVVSKLKSVTHIKRLDFLVEFMEGDIGYQTASSVLARMSSEEFCDNMISFVNFLSSTYHQQTPNSSVGLNQGLFLSL